MGTFTIDLMDLADVGAQPRKAAQEIHRQLRSQCGELPLPVPLRDLADALGIEKIHQKQTTTFDGMLIATPDKSRGEIILREGMLPGRRNFTLGHELGHFTNPYHRPPATGFVCQSADLRARRAGGKAWDDRTIFERMEIEANEFSAALLVPVPEYRVARLGLAGCDLTHLEVLARTFGTSKEFMCRIYVDTAPEKIAVLASKDGRIQRFILPPTFPYLGLAKGHPLPPRSAAVSFLASAQPGQCSGHRSASTDVWLDRSAAGTALTEQTLVQRDGWAMTLLTVDQPEDDEQDEEANIARSWYEPRFAYRK